MIEGDKTSEDITCSNLSIIDGYGPFCSDNIGESPFSSNRKIIISIICSDLKKLNEDVREISFLTSELRSLQDRIFQKIKTLQKPEKAPGIDDSYITESPVPPDINQLLGIVRSDLERIKDEAVGITILKSILWSYHQDTSQKMNSLPWINNDRR
jgi:hypothetical protein